MYCPNCNQENPDNQVICQRCGATIRAATPSVELEKPEKVLNGIMRACEKRPVSLDTIEKIVDDIEASISNSLDREVSTRKIGELIMDKLKNVDEVAYVRFASVYRQFKDINTFMEELNNLLREK